MYILSVLVYRNIPVCFQLLNGIIYTNKWIIIHLIRQKPLKFYFFLFILYQDVPGYTAQRCIQSLSEQFEVTFQDYHFRVSYLQQCVVMKGKHCSEPQYLVSRYYWFRKSSQERGNQYKFSVVSNWGPKPQVNSYPHQILNVCNY